MQSSLYTEEERSESKLTRQAIWFLLHTLLAIGSWLALMGVGYAMSPSGVPQFVILILSMLFPLLVGFIVNKVRQDEMAPVVWLMGLIWVLIVSLWVLDMPTGPNECFQCNATEKLTRTFFSLPQPSGLIDDDGPFIGTWPAAALVGYSIGAQLAMKRKERGD
jgi:hypothetical protein